MNAPFAIPGMLLDPGAPINKGLVGWWPMWEGAGGKCLDISGRNNHGTLTNGPLWTGGGLKFDGVDDYIATTGNAAFDNLFTDGITICAFVKYLDFAAYQRTVSIETSDGVGFETWIQANQTSGLVEFGSGAAGIGYKRSASALVAGVQYHLCGATDYTAAGTKVYINGADNSGTLNATPTYVADKGRITIGALTAGSTLYYGNVSVNNVRIWNRALTDAEVRRVALDPYCGLWTPDYARYYIPAAAGGAKKYYLGGNAANRGQRGMGWAA